MIDAGFLVLTRLLVTTGQRIANETAQTDARRSVRENAALRIQTADARTRIATFVVNARPISIAIVVCDTFGPAARVRIAKVVSNACTRASTVLLFAQCVRTTRRRIAGLRGTLGGYVH